MLDFFPVCGLCRSAVVQRDQEVFSVFFTQVSIFFLLFRYCFNSSHLVEVFYPRGIARGLMARVARRDVDTISNQSGDTFLLSDVDTDFPSVEQQAVLPSSLPVSTVS